MMYTFFFPDPDNRHVRVIILGHIYGATKLGAPGLGAAEGGYPDLFRFVPISPFSSDLFRFALLVFGSTPIRSDLFRFTFFLPICSDLFSEQITEQIRETPFCRPLLQIPDKPKVLDIFETPVTVTPQQEISECLNSSKIP